MKSYDELMKTLSEEYNLMEQFFESNIEIRIKDTNCFMDKSFMDHYKQDLNRIAICVRWGWSIFMDSCRSHPSGRVLMKAVSKEKLGTTNGLYLPSKNEIWINIHAIDPRKIIVHELVHHYQFCTGFLTNDTWNNEKRTDTSKTSWTEKPWERQAQDIAYAYLKGKPNEFIKDLLHRKYSSYKISL